MRLYPQRRQTAMEAVRMTDEIPVYLRECAQCGQHATFSVAGRHGFEIPFCEFGGCAVTALFEMFRRDGDHGSVSVYHLEMNYVTHERSLGDSELGGSG